MTVYLPIQMFNHILYLLSGPDGTTRAAEYLSHEDGRIGFGYKTAKIIVDAIKAGNSKMILQEVVVNF